MTVAELIERLKVFSPNLEVVVDGYEGGVGPFKEPYEVPLLLNHYSKEEWWFGPHEIATSPFDKEPPAFDIKAVYLPR